MINNITTDSTKELLNPDLIPKYINQLPILPVLYPKVMNGCTRTVYHSYTVDAF